MRKVVWGVVAGQKIVLVTPNITIAPLPLDK
jgi:hypothetical protein